MHVYLLLFAVAAVAGFITLARKQNVVLAFVFALFLTLFAGTRFEVGCDFNAYEARFDFLYIGVDWREGLSTVEGGFNLLNIIVRDLGGTYLGVLFAASVIFTACLWRFSLLAPRPMAFLVAAFPILVVQLGMSGIRQALATGFLVLAYAAFARGERLRVAAWVLVAALFHASAVIFLPIALVLGRSVSAKKLLLAALVAAPVVGWFLGERLDVYQERYIDEIYGENSSEGAWIRYAMALFPFIVLEWKRSIIQNSHPELFPLLRLFSLLTFALAAAGFVSTIGLHRLTFYVLPVSIMALLCVAESVLVKRQLTFGRAVPYLFYGGYLVAWFALSTHSRACYVPYDSWLL